MSPWNPIHLRSIVLNRSLTAGTYVQANIHPESSLNITTGFHRFSKTSRKLIQIKTLNIDDVTHYFHQKRPTNNSTSIHRSLRECATSPDIFKP